MANRYNPPGRFDPFLANIDGAEQSSNLLAIQRTLAALEGKEVLLAIDDGRLEVVRYEGPLHLVSERPIEVQPGQPLSISYHREIRYAAFRSRAMGSQGTRLQIERPENIIFWPGRGSIRLDSVLGATVWLDQEGERFPARGVDLSMGGLGVRVGEGQGLRADQSLIVVLAFEEETLRLPARIRSIHQGNGDHRLGLEFLVPSDALVLRIKDALRRGTAQPMAPRI